VTAIDRKIQNTKLTKLWYCCWFKYWNQGCVLFQKMWSSLARCLWAWCRH